MSQPATLTSVVTLAAVFFGGGAIGIGLAAWLVPDSNVAGVLSFLMLPAALIAGFHAWLGLAILILLPRFLRGRARREPPAAEARQVPPGSWSFVAVSSVFGLVAGILCGVLSTSSALTVAGTYWAVATAYGGVVWRLAESGYLPFPDSD